MISYLFGGLGEFVAPRPSVKDELQSLFKAGKYNDILSIIRNQKEAKLNIDDMLDSGVGLIHLASASGSLVFSETLLFYFF